MAYKQYSEYKLKANIYVTYNIIFQTFLVWKLKKMNLSSVLHISNI